MISQFEQLDSRTQPHILVLVPYYRPGYKSGGPISSVEALVGRLGDEFSWTIVTADRDKWERRRYASIPEDGLVVKGDLCIRYLAPGPGRLLHLARILRKADYDLVYVNNLFATHWGVWPLLLHKFGWIKGKPMLVAPRNQFSSGALGIKRLKKRSFCRLAQWAGLWRKVGWHATSSDEMEDIREQVGLEASVWIAPIFPNGNLVIAQNNSAIPSNTALRLILLARISPMKNLEGALEVVEQLTFPINFDIAGPVDDAEYWDRIKRIIVQLPEHIKVTHIGSVEPENVRALLGCYHAMLLPTRGENFGHVILEALAAGCPPIISDRTPWKDLKEKRCGWVIPLEKVEGFRNALMELNVMSVEEHKRMCLAAQDYARAHIENPDITAANLKMFQEALGNSR